MKFLNLPVFPNEASSTAGLVDRIFLSFSGICAVVFLIVVVSLVYFMAKYRHGRRANRHAPPRILLGLEIAWTAIPFAIFLFFFAWAAWAYYQEGQAPRDAMLVYAFPKQWMWKFEYPSGRRLVNELYVPVNRPVKLLMSSQDVIHSFYVPAFRLKQDVLPFRYTMAWFQASKPGEYPVFCAEYCGTAHALMRAKVIVLSQSDYARWQTQGDLEGAELKRKDMASQGRELFTELGCQQCHFSNDGRQAPELEGLYGREVVFNDRRRLKADENYIRESILFPNTKIVQGYPPLMPSFKTRLNEEKLAALVEYVKRLKNADAEFQQEKSP